MDVARRIEISPGVAGLSIVGRLSILAVANESPAGGYRNHAIA